MDVCSLKFNVTLNDVGENNELTNRGILRMLQEAACVHSDACGISVNTSKINGLAWVILNWKLKVFSRPCWNTSLTVNTWSSNISQLEFYRDFEILDNNNNLIAVATSRWVLVDINKGSIAKISNELRSNYIIVNKHVFDEPMIEKIAEPELYSNSLDYTVLKRDIDTNHHVNNISYLDIANEILPENINYDNLEIMYKHEAKLGEKLSILYAKENSTSFITIKSLDGNKLHCIVKMY